MLRETLVTNIKRIIDFLIYSRNFLIRKSPIKALINSIVESLKDFLTMKKKLKMAQYRLNYHRHQFQKMEQLIAENNQHSFLKGNNLNETR
ncbi:TPA: hypothetical protein IAC10_09875 [Candidatus Scatousia excrementigallinarum]|uniref:Uncharacterized protein n=1 Tax=Candidatus Scatousia excrementigallinarum TaxID=2840935 RepID=A0A9D1JND3_9BACT|nr:hypothetical protein [Candidatus Scatousia excrementigallinarum]